MKKRIIFKLFILIIILISIFVFIIKLNQEKNKTKNDVYQSNMYEIDSQKNIRKYFKNFAINVNKHKDFKSENEEIDDIDSEYEQIISEQKTTGQWFIEYKEFINKHPNKKAETIYETFSQTELDLLFKVVQAEVGNYDFSSKVNVANVIFNRVKDEKFEDTLNEILINSQFATISNNAINKVTVDEETILACEYAFIFEDTTNGALFFDSTDGNSWAARNKKWIFKDEAGHNFYK